MQPEILPASYDVWGVILSFLVSTAGAYTALWVASSTLQRRAGAVSKVNIFLAGLALGGVGIWSMHFLGMLAYEVPLSVGYRPLETIVSLVAAVAVSCAALGYIAAAKFEWRRLFIAGPLAGIGVAVMHYLGMYAMSFGGYMDWNWGIVALSVLIAIVAATAALWLAFHTHTHVHRIGAAFLMGAAVCTMHYTGMGAASVVCTTSNRYAWAAGVMKPTDLGFYVSFIAVSIAALIAMDVLMQRLQAAQAANASR